MVGFLDMRSVSFLVPKKIPKVDINTWEHIHRVFPKNINNVYCISFIEKDKSPKEWDLKRVIKHYEK